MKKFMFMIVCLAGSAAAQGDLKTTLAKLDASSAKFTSAEARVHRESYNAVIKETDYSQDGSIYFLRAKSGSAQMGLKTEGRDARTLEYKNGTLKVFNPGLDCFDTVTRPGVETYLTLGFGGSGKDLEKAWIVTDVGPETMGGAKVEHLDLVPRDPAVKNNFNKVSLWLDLDRDVTYKQIFYSSTGDYKTAVFSKIETKKAPKVSAYAFGGKPCGK